MNTAFALDLPTPSAIEQASQWLMKNSRSNSFMLVDSALLDTSRLDRIVRRGNLHVESAYANSPLAGFGEYAPRLLELSGREDFAVDVMRSLLTERSGVAALSLMAAQRGQTMRQMQALCSFLARISVNDNLRPLHMRMADTRVIHNFFKVLSSAQMDVVAANVNQWGWFSRDGQWQPRKLSGSAGSSGNISLQEPMKLTSRQFSQLQRLGEPDRLFVIIDRRLPELVPEDGFAEFYASLAHLLEIADGYRVRHPDDRLQFVVLGLKCGAQFHLHPGLKATWKAVGLGERLLFQMRHWDDGVWADLQGKP